MNKLKKIKYQFYEFANPSATTSITQTLVLNNPAEVRFLCYSSVLGAINASTINKIYRLQPFGDTNSGTALYPSELVLYNNENEIDVTQYVITINPNVTMYVICKYFVQD